MSIFESVWIFLVSGYVLPESPFDAWKNGRMVDVPVVVGKILARAKDSKMAGRAKLVMYMKRATYGRRGECDYPVKILLMDKNE